MIRKYLLSGIVAASVAVSGCSGGEEKNVDSENVFDDVVSPPATPGVGGSVYDTIVVHDTQFSMLRKAIDLAGLADELDDERREFTLFAPDDAAFEMLDAGARPTPLDILMADTDALSRLLRYHLVPASFDEVTLDAAAAVGTTLPTLIKGESLTVTTDGASIVGLAINGAGISTTDMVLEVADGKTTAGIVHSIVAVLEVPEETVGPGTPAEGAGAIQTSLETAGNFSIFLSLGFLDSYETNVWTVFAPTDEAIAAAGATPNIQDLVAVNAGAMTAAELLAAGSVSTNLGKEYAVTGTEGALLVDGKAVELVATGAAGTLVYSLDGMFE